MCGGNARLEAGLTHLKNSSFVSAVQLVGKGNSSRSDSWHIHWQVFEETVPTLLLSSKAEAWALACST